MGKNGKNMNGRVEKVKQKKKQKKKTPKQNKINNTTVKEQYKTKLVGEMTRSHIGNLDNKMYYVH